MYSLLSYVVILLLIRDHSENRTGWLEALGWGGARFCHSTEDNGVLRTFLYISTDQSNGFSKQYIPPVYQLITALEANHIYRDFKISHL